MVQQAGALAPEYVVFAWGLKVMAFLAFLNMFHDRLAYRLISKASQERLFSLLAGIYLAQQAGTLAPEYLLFAWGMAGTAFLAFLDAFRDSLVRRLVGRAGQVCRRFGLPPAMAPVVCSTPLVLPLVLIMALAEAVSDTFSVTFPPYSRAWGLAQEWFPSRQGDLLMAWLDYKHEWLQLIYKHPVIARLTAIEYLFRLLSIIFPRMAQGSRAIVGKALWSWFSSGPR